MTLKEGELVLYDMSGSSIELNSPTLDLEEMAVGMVVRYYSSLGGASPIYEILDCSGNVKRINESYIKSVE